MLTLNIFILFAFVLQVFAAKCPNGEKIYKLGISEEGKKVVIDLHNMYRRMIKNGTVPGQPKGKDLKPMVFDEQVAILAREKALTCEFKYNVLGAVGLNLYSESIDVNNIKENWAWVLETWWSEKEHFKYAQTEQMSIGYSAHYTQMVWARSYAVGCDFIAFHHVKFGDTAVYICLYSPGGNWKDQLPYLRAK